MKLKDLKPSVGLMRLWIVSVVVIFILNFNLFLPFTLVTWEEFWKDLGLSILWNLVEYFIGTNEHVLVSTLVYVITSAIAYLMVMWVKEGFSKSKDGN